MNFSRKTLAATLMLAAASSQAQITSSSIRGQVTSPSGEPAQASIKIIHEPSGRVSEISTNGKGFFSAKGLRVGGPYRIIIDSDVYADSVEENVFLQLGQVYKVNGQLSEQATIEEVVVTGSAINRYDSAGPSAVFDLTTLQTAPAVNRNLTDIIRQDPRLYVSNDGLVQCGGKHPRFNSLTVDGVRMNDSFGLNNNGYPTERMPFSFDAIEQVSAELAPYDAQYGGFTACNMNAVTKSGGNEFSGSMFYDFVDESMKGDSLEGDKVSSPDFSESRLGFTLGGPIIKDKLFFFTAYEKLEGTNLFDRGVQGSGAVQEVDVTQAELDRIVDIARNQYLYDPGELPSAMDNEDEKLLVKVDWNISDDHRLALTYNYNDGFNIREADGDNDELEFSNHLFERGAKLNSFNGTLFSDWSDSFSTQITFNQMKLDNRQLSLGGTDFGEIRVITSGNVDVYLGSDDSRQSNKLKYDMAAFRFKGIYDIDDHSLSFGVEREDLNVFNLFVQHTETEIRFASIDDFETGDASRIYYNNSAAHNPNDAAAEWGYELNTLFAQDNWQLANNMQLSFGLRYDWYTSNDKPQENPAFTDDYGFSNAQNLDGEGLLQPRVALNIDVTDNLEVRMGAGLYTGGNPNVWLSNNFSGTNTTQFGVSEKDFNVLGNSVAYRAVEEGAPAGAGAGWGIPEELYIDVENGGNYDMSVLDPNFKLPSETKFSVGATYTADNDFSVTADILYSLSNDPAIIRHAGLVETGETDDQGHPVFARRAGTDGESVTQALMLTNSSKTPKSLLVSLGLSQSYDFGLDWTFGYAFSDAEDVQPMSNSVAFSNYIYRAFFNPQVDEVATSNYNIRHRFTGSLNYTADFIGGYETTVSLFATANEGSPYSYTVSSGDIYSTPYLDGGDQVLAPGQARNGQKGSWWGKADMRISQELPAFNSAHKASAFLLVDNLTNLLNDEWGVLYQANFPGNVVRGEQPDESRRGDASLYEIRVGMQYSF